MNKKAVLIATIAALSSTACASSMDASVTAQAAQTVTEAAQAVQADTVEEVLTQNINIPLHYMLLFGAACTFVPNPLQLVGRAFSMLFGGIIHVWKTFKGG